MVVVLLLTNTWTMASLKLIYLFTLVIFITFVTTEADLDDDLSSYLCSPDNQTTPNSAYHSNLKRLLSYLSSNATAKKQFYNTKVSSANQSDSVCGMFGCWSNVPTELCSKCVTNITANILSDSYTNCPLSTNAWFIGDRCVLRYSNCSSFSTPDLSSPGGLCVYSDVSNYPNFLRLKFETIKEVADEAANSGNGTKNYGTKEARIGGYQSLYCEAKCTPDLSPLDCTKCLNLTTTQAQQFCPPDLMTKQNPSCSVRCDVYPFFRPLDVLASNVDSQNTTYLSHNCSKTKTINSTTNLMTLLSSLSSSSANKVGFFKTTVHSNISDSDPVSGMFMCRGDVSHALCHLCVVNAIKRISLECPSSKEAITWYDECLVRYSDGKSLSTLDTSPAYHEFNIVNTPNPNHQQSVLRYNLVNTLSGLLFNTGDGSIKNYATKATKLNDHETLYTLAQCTPDLSYSDCSSCLGNIFNDKEIPWCCMGSPEGKVLYPSCYIMFSLSQFYRDDNQVEANRQGSNTPPAIPENNKNRAKRTITILIVVFVIVSAILLSFCCYLRRRKARKVNYKALLRKNFGQESTTLEVLQFDLSVVKAATNNFSRQNKIGKGGFGEVYKGILSNGRHIAVKRLPTSSKQGSVEFENEVLLIAKLQHRNLVTLIGFCLEDHEQILIYEYMPNGSLDHLLFGTQQQKLHWSERYKIISGTALGILYLHEYSRLKVIHRDLKPSNVLLDENMNPKISDFGMARIVDINKDHGNTNRIAGTYGYMSPEYAMLGQFSEKSDIFSFGVMVLEIITGKRNVNLYESNSVVEGLIGYVWRRWKNQEPLSILDSHIKENYAQMEVMKCIHIGLLCVQEIPSVRPTMTTIISYLNNHSLELPSPQEPAFLMHSHIMDQEIGTHQESGSNQADNGFKMFSINEMSTSSVYPR